MISVYSEVIFIVNTTRFSGQSVNKTVSFDIKIYQF